MTFEEMKKIVVDTLNCEEDNYHVRMQIERSARVL